MPILNNMSEELSDNKLMEQFCAGEVHVFQLLYARHEKPLYRYIRRLLGKEERLQAEDVFQETWIKLVDARQRWQAHESASFKTWLYTLAHNRAIDVLRQSGRELSIDEGWTSGDNQEPWHLWPASNAEQPEQKAFWRKAGQQLLGCLEALPVLQRAAFLLHHEDGLTLDEISEIFNAEFETVKSRLRYALDKLRNCMGAYMQPILEQDNNS